MAMVVFLKCLLLDIYRAARREIVIGATNPLDDALSSLPSVFKVSMMLSATSKVCNIAAILPRFKIQVHTIILWWSLVAAGGLWRLELRTTRLALICLPSFPRRPAVESFMIMVDHGMDV